jgi:hypothetical protein
MRLFRLLHDQNTRITLADRLPSSTPIAVIPINQAHLELGDTLWRLSFPIGVSQRYGKDWRRVRLRYPLQSLGRGVDAPLVLCECSDALSLDKASLWVGIGAADRVLIAQGFLTRPTSADLGRHCRIVVDGLISHETQPFDPAQTSFLEGRNSLRELRG